MTRSEKIRRDLIENMLDPATDLLTNLADRNYLQAWSRGEAWGEHRDGTPIYPEAPKAYYEVLAERLASAVDASDNASVQMDATLNKVRQQAKDAHRVAQQAETARQVLAEQLRAAHAEKEELAVKYRALKADRAEPRRSWWDRVWDRLWGR